MAARSRSSQRDFNRRRHLILSKGHDMVFYQRGTNLSKCLFKTIPKEEEENKRKMAVLSKYRRECSMETYFKQRKFLENQWQRSIEPSILMQRPPTRSKDNHNVPRHRRPVTCSGLRDNVIDTLVLARPCMRNKFNLWEGSAEEAMVAKKSSLVLDSSFAHEPSLKERTVHFESAVSAGGALSKVDQKDLFQYWYQMRISSGRDDKTKIDLIEWSSKKNRQSDQVVSLPSTALVPCPSAPPTQRARCIQSAPNQRRGVFITQADSFSEES